MRLNRDETVAGVMPDVARDLARLCHLDWRDAEWVAARLKIDARTTAGLLAQLTAGGYLQQREERGETEWHTTMAGGALTMASFLKPITRAKADELLAEVIARVETYNGDDSKPYLITKLTAFGSYLNPDAVDLGDLDLCVGYDERSAKQTEPQALLDYTYTTGRKFPSILDRMFWPKMEIFRTVRGKSPYVNVTDEDLSVFTDQTKVVYEYAKDNA